MGESVNNGALVIEGWLMGSLFWICYWETLSQVTRGLLVSGDARGGSVSLWNVQSL